MYKIKKEIIIIILLLSSMICLVYGVISTNVLFAKIGLFGTFLTVCLDTIKNLKENIILFIFYCTFFLFSLGQYIFPTSSVRSGYYYNMYEFNIVINTIVLQYISILCVYIFFFLSKAIFKKDISKKEFCYFNEEKINKGLIFTILAFFIVIAIINYLNIGIKLINNGYESLYNNTMHSESIYMNLISYLAGCFPIVTFISLALVRYSKKSTYLVLILYFIYLCLTLFSGTRGEFGTGLLIIIAYIFIFKVNINKEVIEKKKIAITISIGIIVLILLCSALNIYNSLRNHQEIREFNIVKQVEEFLCNQSSSVNLISLAQANKKELLQDNTLYVFGPIVQNINNKFKKLQLDINIFSNYKKSFAKDISIIGLGKIGFESGQGLGSQYIAELYIDYGYAGVVIFNCILGVALYYLSFFYKKNFIKFSMSLLILQSILFISRGHSLQPLNVIFSINYWVTILIYLGYIKFVNIWGKDKC